MSCGPAMISYSCWFIQVCVFFEYLAECFTYVCVAAVDVTRDVIDVSTLVFFGFLSLGCTIIERRVFASLWYMCMLCDLLIRPSCSDNPSTYGSPSIDLRVLLFVLGGPFALDGGGASAHSGYPLPLTALWTCFAPKSLYHHNKKTKWDYRLQKTHCVCTSIRYYTFV